MIPGSNILSAALSIIGAQSFTYHAFVSRSTNAVGYDVPVYAAGVATTGSVQPIPRVLYEQYGLDLQKNYVNFFVSKSVVDITRDVSGDYFVYNNKRFQCQSKTDWFAQDSWVQILCVEIPNA